MEGSRMSNIPSDEDFARAEKRDRERSRNLEEVRAAVLARFKRVCHLYEFFILPQIDVDFRAYVFFETDRDTEACKRDGTTQEIVDFIYSAIEHAGCGRKGQSKVGFEFDSDENVKAHYQGDYFLRLR